MPFAPVQETISIRGLFFQSMDGDVALFGGSWLRMASVASRMIFVVRQFLGVPKPKLMDAKDSTMVAGQGALTAMLSRLTS